MHKSLAAGLVAAIVAAVATTSVFAQATDAQKQAAEKWKQMTPEEQAAAKAKAKTKWDSMTPEQQAAAKQQFAEKHPHAAKRMESKHAASAPAAVPAPAK